MHVQKHPNAEIHTHLHTIMLSQHTVAGYICARANSKQLWSSYQNRSPKAPSVQLLCTKSFISLDSSHTINHGYFSIIVMYIFLWSHLTILDWIHYANTLSRMLMSVEIVFTVCPPLSLCCVYAVVIVFLNQTFRVTDCCLSVCLCVYEGKKGETLMQTWSVWAQNIFHNLSNKLFPRDQFLVFKSVTLTVLLMLLRNVLTVFV